MSLANYADLQTSMTGWLGNSVNSASYPDMITLFEAAANRRLKVRQQETTTLLSPANGSTALPTDFLSWRRLTWNGPNYAVELEYVEPSYLQYRYPTSTSDIPRVFTIEGANILIRPTDSTASSLTFDYYAKVPSLSSVASTNWLLTAHPDVYLFGSLCEAEMFGVDDARAPAWKARRDEVFEEIHQLANKSRGAGSIKVKGPTP